ncbi:hypothetical protein N0V84_008590 [Fusarium piperis]|uniref:Uncharacterized protein n=1 Tax=Fusarium piperis TaxID=1435070 RepID=A0A9W8W7U2_9HYPO|nr:hypothetical protein N0V84_008590 [Fusarium piperis]
MSSELLTRIELPFLVALRYKDEAGLNDSGYVRPQGSPIPYPPVSLQSSAADFTDPQVRKDCGKWAVLFLTKLLDRYWKFPAAEMWTFSYEENLQETQCDEYRWVGIKVTSPYLEPTYEQYRQLEVILKVLNERAITFASAETRLKLSFIPRQGAFSLERLKEMASMLWVTDPLLSKLHPPHCGPGSLPSLGFQFTNIAREKHPIDLNVEMGLGVLVDDPWTDRLSWHRRQLRIIAHPGELSEGKYRPGLDKINKAESIPDLLHLLALPVKRGIEKFKFQAAYDFQYATDTTHPRIELNQHCGTLYGPVIVDWVAICKFVLEPPRPEHDSCLIAASRILRQRIEQGFTVFDCLTSDGMQRMMYYTPDKEPFQVPDLAEWPVRKRPVLKYDPEPGLVKSFVSLDDVEKEAQNWARFTKGVKGASNCTYSFGVELEMMVPTAQRPTKALDPSIYSYQFLGDPPDQIFMDIREKLILRTGSGTGAVRQASHIWTPSFPGTESNSTTGKDDLAVDIDIGKIDPELLDRILADPEASSSDVSMRDADASPEASFIDADTMDIDPSSDEDDTPDDDPDPKDPREIARGSHFPRRAHHIAGIITSLGHPAHFICNNSNGTGRPWKRQLAESGLFHVSDLKLNYHAWSLEPDGSLAEAPGWGRYWKLTGLELISPVCQDVTEDWERILEVVGGLATNVRVIASINCGLHVHVGKGQQVLPIHLIRKMFCLMCCVENIVFSLCHPYRKYMSYSAALMAKAEEIRRYTDIKAPHPDLKKHVPDEIEENPLLWDVLKAMWIARNLDEIKAYCRKVSMSIGTCQPLNADGKPPTDHEEEVYVKGTVEFRHQEGTMDPELVLRWGQLAVALFQFADLAKADAWRRLIRTALKCKDSTDYNLDILKDFLQQLGLGEDFQFWRNRIHSFKGIRKLKGGVSLIIATIGQPPPHLNFESVISNERMEALRKDVCQRDRKPPYLA